MVKISSRLLMLPKQIHILLLAIVPTPPSHNTLCYTHSTHTVSPSNTHTHTQTGRKARKKKKEAVKKKRVQ